MEISQKIVDKFFEEARERMGELDQLFSSLQNNPKEMSLYHPIYRIFHEFHGSAEMFGLAYLGLMSGVAEKIVKNSKESEKPLKNDVIKLLTTAKDMMKKCIDEKCSDKECMNDLIEKLKKVIV